MKVFLDLCWHSSRSRLQVKSWISNESRKREASLVGASAASEDVSGWLKLSGFSS